MKLQKKLNAEELAAQIVFSHNLIKETRTGWEEQKAMATWRVEIFEWVKQADIEETNYILTYLQKEYPVAYLEVLSMVTEYRNEKKIPITMKEKVVNSIIRIKNKMVTKKKKEGEYETVCTNSPIYLRRDSNDYGDTGPTESSGPIHG